MSKVTVLTTSHRQIDVTQDFLVALNLLLAANKSRSSNFFQTCHDEANRLIDKFSGDNHETGIENRACSAES